VFVGFRRISNARFHIVGVPCCEGKALISHTFQNAKGLDKLGIHVGDQVKVSYQNKDGQNSVVRVDEVKPRDASAQ